MTKTLKVKYLNHNCKLEIHGDFIDLKTSETITFTKNNEYRAIPLGVCIELPKHFIAKIVPRSSTFKRFRIIQANSIGIIDYNYKGDNDQWFFPAVHFRKREDSNCIIEEGTRIAQFEIMPSQFAPWWVKLNWIFSSKIKIVEVNKLGNDDRGGLGSTNTK